MEIIVDSAGYPTEQIAKNSHDYRPLGLGYANLGALLMAFGLPYDSDAGRDFAGTLTSILCGDAYWQSARIAETCPALGAATPLTQQTEISGGACPGFYVNREPFLDVIRMHRAEVNNIGKATPAQPRNASEPFSVPQLENLVAASRHAWDGALAHGEKYGYRNSQVTVLAPTGTIGFMMDCDTTGVEPDLALVKYKKLVGGGMIKIVNSTVPSALIKLGYSEAEVNAIVSYIDATGTIEGAPGIKHEHLAVFDCSFKPAKGTRSISYMGHIRMMAATQPFLSGAISKTVNLPQDCSVQDIADAYLAAWKSGLKAVAIYRDNSKGTQPLNVTAQTDADKKGTKAIAAALPLVAAAPAAQDNTAELAALTMALADSQAAAASAQSQASSLQAQIATLEMQIRSVSEAATRNADSIDAQAPPRAVRHRLPAERASVTHKFGLSGHEGYLTVGLYPNGTPGEIFIRMAKEGSTISGLMDSFATAISMCLQHGVPLKLLCEKFAHTRFEPSGWTGNPEIGYAKSIMDYIFRWMQLRFLSGHQLSLFAGLTPAVAIPVEGMVTSPSNRVEQFGVDQLGQSGLPALAATTESIGPQSGAAAEAHQHERESSFHPTPGSYGADIASRIPTYSASVDASPQAILEREQREREQRGASSPYGASANEPAFMARDLTARSGLNGAGARNGAESSTAGMQSFADRGIYAPAEAMRSMYDMGDAPSCATCGAIMTRSGSCYRCMSCGSTSGCS
jgi:ribonucleoside-diphosphate reductase alpha chain